MLTADERVELRRAIDARRRELLGLDVRPEDDPIRVRAALGTEGRRLGEVATLARLGTGRTLAVLRRMVEAGEVERVEAPGRRTFYRLAR
jgi:hypothetical protein